MLTILLLTQSLWSAVRDEEEERAVLASAPPAVNKYLFSMHDARLHLCRHCIFMHASLRCILFITYPIYSTRYLFFFCVTEATLY